MVIFLSELVISGEIFAGVMKEAEPMMGGETQGPALGKVIIGGSPCNETVRQYTGADYYAKDAAEGARICKGIYI